jgi:transposase-like protein
VLFLDGIALKVRMARRVVSVPVFVAPGGTEDGTKRVVALALAVRGTVARVAADVADLTQEGLPSDREHQPRVQAPDQDAGLVLD